MAVTTEELRREEHERSLAHNRAQGLMVSREAALGWPTSHEIGGSGYAAISAEERARRQANIDFARANVQLEGFVPPRSRGNQPSLYRRRNNGGRTRRGHPRHGKAWLSPSTPERDLIPRIRAQRQRNPGIRQPRLPRRIPSAPLLPAWRDRDRRCSHPRPRVPVRVVRAACRARVHRRRWRVSR